MSHVLTHSVSRSTDYAAPSATSLAEAELPAQAADFRATVAMSAPVTPLRRPKVCEAIVRSILFRRRLAETLTALEVQVLEALREAGREAFRVGNYVVRDTPGGLAITEADPVDTRQLELPLP